MNYNNAVPLDKRRSGVLLHISSLPGPYDNGVIGEDAYRFVDFLSEAGYSVWQTLPLGPTHGDGSPYQSLSVHAGNAQFIDLQWLVDRNWLAQDELDHCANKIVDRAKCLMIAFNNFRKLFDECLCGNKGDCSVCGHSKCDKSVMDAEQCMAFQTFIKEQAFWLDDYALYCALKKKYQKKSWFDWPEEVKQRKNKTLNKEKKKLRYELFYCQFEQFLFFSQWHSLKNYANERGVYLFGDLPIFVAHDSADVWAQRQFFKLNTEGCSEVVAGVPPDYFSATGQRWGNPHYQWDTIEETKFSWWLERIRTQQLLFDVIRIDHFRGLESSWEIPADEETAINGTWVKSPGKNLLKALYKSYPELSLVAEDLGIITDEVNELREQFNLPGMKVLQFAFSGESSNPYLPHNHELNGVVYTGTHDNDTTLSWLESLTDEEKNYLRQYFNFPHEELSQVLNNTALASIAKLAILPMQDLIGAGVGQRMNTPGTTEGNWQWRFSWPQLTEEYRIKAREMNVLYARMA